MPGWPLQNRFVASISPDFYLQWQAQNEERLLLREAGSPQPTERVLQSVWRHQRVRRDALRALDGQGVRVLHPGFWNKGAGPDFRGAVVQIGDAAPRSGDVEIDLVGANWRAHAHHTNPAYAKVILHVLWNGPAEPVVPCATLALEPHLDSPMAELQSWADSPLAEGWPAEFQGACSAPLREIPSENVRELLRQAALARLQRKARELEIRARHASWEQALWEGLFRALGYKQNIWPMQRLAELRARLCDGPPAPLPLQARLLGVGGLLRTETNGGNSHLRTLWDYWWRDRDNFSDVLLPRSIWSFHGLRPANQPQRRVALASHWLSAGNVIASIEAWFAAEPSPSPAALLERLQPPADDYWAWHWGLATGRLAKPQPLLGESRATDLAVNVILPWLWARGGVDGGAGDARRRAESLYLSWPAAQDNSVLRLTRQRLFGHPAPRWLNTAAAQQGLLQIVRDFCSHTDALCADCIFPNLVRSLAASAAAAPVA